MDTYVEDSIAKLRKERVKFCSHPAEAEQLLSYFA